MGLDRDQYWPRSLVAACNVHHLLRPGSVYGIPLMNLHTATRLLLMKMEDAKRVGRPTRALKDELRDKERETRTFARTFWIVHSVLAQSRHRAHLLNRQRAESVVWALGKSTLSMLDIAREPTFRGTPMPDIEISKVKQVAASPDGSAVIVKAEVALGDSRSEVEIAITTDLAANVAIALLATTAQARAARDGLLPALEVLAAAVVASGSAEKVRLHLLFDKGSVLPIEVPSPAAANLSKDLIAALVRDSQARSSGA